MQAKYGIVVEQEVHMRTDYESGLLQVSAAIQNYYGIDTGYRADETVKAWLDDHGFRCVIVLLVDAMGSYILNKLLERDTFLHQYKAKSMMSVFPPTTTAATTSLLTGKSPAENGWLGWNQYFEELDDHVILFLEQSYYGKEKYPGFVQKSLPVTWIMDKLRAKGIHAESVWPSFGKENPCETFSEVCEKTKQLSMEQDVRFIYAYWDGFDDLMHINGTEAPVVYETLRHIDDEITHLAYQLREDTGLLILADHGMVDMAAYDLAKDKELCALFRHKPALEPRATAFYIREEKLSRFEALFHERFGNAFELLRQQDVIQQRVFGPGIMERHLAEFTGDYLAVANTPLSFTYGKKAMKAHHAGGMEEELMIPLILYPQRRKDVYNETNEKNRNCMDMHSAFACDGMHEE